MPPDWTDGLEVICADIGSIPQGRFAWARRLPAESSESSHDPTSIETMAAAIVPCLRAGTPVAVGFEMPLFLPVCQRTRMRWGRPGRRTSARRRGPLQRVPA
jgi:hypothetical protein